MGRFEWSRQKYDGGDYRAAIRGFKDFLLREPVHPLADSARYLLGESYLKSDQELLAAEQLSRMASSSPNSPLADDAQFGVCEAYWKLSPGLPLDQEYTEKAIDECQKLAEYYPLSPHVKEARRIRDEARNKMAEKLYRIGQWYFKKGLYESANIYFEWVVRDYAGTEILPKTLAQLYRSYRKVGFDAEADSVRQQLLEHYGDSDAAHRLSQNTSSDPAPQGP